MFLKQLLKGGCLAISCFIFLSCSGSGDSVNKITESINLLHLDYSGDYDSIIYQTILNNKFPNCSPKATNNQIVQLDGLEYRVCLTERQDSICFYNYKTMSHKKVKGPANVLSYVYSVYCHNLDSVFLITDKQKLMLSQIEDIEDIYLLNGEGSIVNSYSLGDVPFADFSNKDTITMVSRFMATGNRILNDHLYIPIMLYKPYDASNISHLAKLDLRSENLEMLSVFNPSINKKNRKQIQDLDFTILNDNKILISFYSEYDIFIYDIQKDSLIIQIGASKFPMTLKSNKAIFYKPIYCELDSIYIRKIQIDEFQDYPSFILFEILDYNLESLGFVSKNQNTDMSCSAEGKMVEYDLKNNWLGAFVQVSAKQTIPIDSIINALKPSAREVLIDPEVGYNSRLRTYCEKMFKNADSRHVVLINTSSFCYNCLEYFAEQSATSDETIFFLLYGNNLNNLRTISELFEFVPSEQVVIDVKSEYINHLQSSEIDGKPIFVKLNDDTAIVIPVSANDIHSQYEKFIEMQ